MLRILGLVTIVMLVLVLGAPSLYAQEWRTYINPELGFQIDYPYKSYTHIIEHETLPSVLIVEDFHVMVDLIKLNNTSPHNINKVANNTITNYIIDFGRQTIEDIHPITYSNMSGLSATLYMKNYIGDEDGIQKFVFIEHDNTIYQFLLETFTTNFNEDKFDKMLNSLKFL
jgi:hypothetical protein